MSNMQGLDNALITQLLSGSRGRNTYGPRLAEFMESDEAGINPVDVWPTEFSGKKGTALYQGFLNAAKNAKIEDQVRILQSEGNVYLVHKARAAAIVEAAQNTEA